MSKLGPEELQRVQHLLGREPNEVERGIFTVMWSEHCCYKSSKRVAGARGERRHYQ